MERWLLSRQRNTTYRWAWLSKNGRGHSRLFQTVLRISSNLSIKYPQSEPDICLPIQPHGQYRSNKEVALDKYAKIRDTFVPNCIIFPSAIQYNVLVIQAIIFDIGGVVTYNIGGYVKNDIIKTLGVTKNQYEEACHILIPLLSTARITEEEFWQRFRDITKNTKVPPENLWSREFSKRRKLRKDVVQIIKDLKQTGIKLAALSNVIRSHSQVNDEKGIYRLFDVRILSCEVGLKKPDPQIYQLTLKKLGAKPEETVFIDNKLQNVKVARDLGFKGIYYKNPGQLRKSLERLKLI